MRWIKCITKGMNFIHVPFFHLSFPIPYSKFEIIFTRIYLGVWGLGFSDRGRSESPTHTRNRKLKIDTHPAFENKEMTSKHTGKKRQGE